MADFLTAVKSVRNSDENRNDDSLLTAVESKNLRALSAIIPQKATGQSQGDERWTRTVSDEPPKRSLRSHDKERKTGQDGSDSLSAKPVGTPANALEVLRSQPDLDTLTLSLQQLQHGNFDEPFNLDVPGPLQAQIINALLSEIVPNFWPSYKRQHGQLLASVLRNVAGLNAVIARLRLLASQNASAESIKDLLEISSMLFADDGLVLSVWRSLWPSIQDRRKQEMAWKEAINLLGSGKVTAAAAQAEDAMRAKSDPHSLPTNWLANGGEYTAWLGRNIATILQHADDQREKACIEDAAPLLAKGMSLGHPGRLIKELLVYSTKRGEEATRVERLRGLIHSTPAHSKRAFTEHLLRWLSSAITPEQSVGEDSKTSKRVPATAGLLSTLIEGDERMLQHLQSHLTDPALSSSLSLPVQRACLAVLARGTTDNPLEQLLEKLIATFSTTLFIAHAPIAQQEALARSVLIAAGYVHRAAPMSLLMTARSSGHMQGVSNRLDSSNARARWLGMVVGTTLSRLVDKPGSQMTFGIEELSSKEAMWYSRLVDTDDTVGTFEDFSALLREHEQMQRAPKVPRTAEKPSKKPTMINGKPVFGPPRPPSPAQTKIIGDRVTEIFDDAADETDDLKPYAKPDSDPEDSDEDATLVNRNKARAPVYIRDLMAGLRDDQNFDRFNLAIKTAASLIRRKAGFGKEVKDHAEELAGMLSNLQDPFDLEGFDDMRLQALVAVLLSDVKAIAPLLSRQAFAEGYSIAQRCVILSALGLGGRELAGFKIEDEDYNPKLSNTDFPSKRLPSKLHAIYSSPSNNQNKRLEAASQTLERQMIQPMALQAADQSTAHLNAVKIRTFSSRMEVEKARTKRKPPANELARCFGESYFFPLANRYQQEIAAYGSGSVFASAPFVLVTFVKTLALLLHASGPATLGLPGISAEMWDLLLSLRVQAIGDISVLQAVLFALLTLLEVNTDRQRIVQEHPKQLMETQQWVDLVFERMGSGGLVDDDGKSEEAKVRTLAAGVLMKCREIIEAYQKQLVGYGYDMQ